MSVKPRFRPDRQNRRVSFVIIVMRRLLLLCVSFLVPVWPGAQAAPALIAVSPRQATALGIETVLVGAEAAGRQLALPARVAVPNDQLRVVSAPVAGLVEALELAPGQSVKKGQPVARLSGPAIGEVQREYLLAANEVALAQRSLARDEQLYAEGIIGRARLEATRAAAERAGLLANERRQALQMAGVSAGARLGGTLTLTAPIDGVVLEQSAAVGQRVEAAAVLYRIARLAPLWLEIQAPVDTAAGLREGAVVRVAGTAAQGRIIAIGRAVEAASQTVMVRARIDSGTETLRAGQSVEAQIELAVAEGLSLPSSALARQGEKTHVFVAVGQGDKSGFEPREVRVLRQSGDAVLVTGALKPGERVAVRGVAALKASWMGIGQE